MREPSSATPHGAGETPATAPLPPAEPAPPAVAEQLATAAAHGARSRRFAPVIIPAVIVISVLFVVAMAALIYYRSVTARFPSSFIVIESPPGETLNGATVTVSADGHEVATVTLNDANNDIAYVLVEPGLLDVTTRLNGVTTRQRLGIGARQARRVYATTRPARR